MRYVYIPGWTDAPSDIQQLIAFCKAQPSLEGIELLPYHVLGRHKWDEMHVPYPMEGVPLPSNEKVQEVMQEIEAAGLTVLSKVEEPKRQRWMGSRS